MPANRTSKPTGAITSPGYRHRHGQERSVAATMLNQSKTAHQAEIDAACEVIDFLRFNVDYLVRIYGEQPISSPGVWNRMEYRPLEGFVLAISIMLLLWVLSWLLVFGILALPGVGDALLKSYPVLASGAGELLQVGLARRVISSGGWITLLLLLGLTTVAGIDCRRQSAELGRIEPATC